jgi:glycosyltransferase involved in cell wall biosynthesis
MAGPRVLFFIDSLHSGGAQRQIVVVFNELRARGVDAWISYYYDKQHFLDKIPAEDHDRVTCLGAEPGSHPLALVARVRTHLRELAPDVVCSFLRGASSIIGMCRLSGVDFRWIASERSSGVSTEPLARRGLYVATARLADLVAPNANTTVPEWLDLGFPPHRVRWLPNGVPTDEAMLATPPREPEQPLRLLAVGTLDPRKQYLTLIEALGRLKDRSWTLDHLGRNDSDPEHRKAVDAAIARHGLQDRVTLHGPQKDVGRWYAQAHILMHPSLVEGFPNVLLEAWAWGCPVLVSNRGEMAQLVRSGVNGIVCDPTDTDAFVEALAGVLDDPARLPEMGAAGRAEVVSRFTIKAAADNWLDAIETVTNDPGLRGRLLRRAGLR